MDRTFSHTRVCVREKCWRGAEPPRRPPARLDALYRRAAGLVAFIDRVAERGGVAESEHADLDRLIEQIDSQRLRLAS
jgi:hypothetical protein